MNDDVISYLQEAKIFRSDSEFTLKDFIEWTAALSVGMVIITGSPLGILLALGLMTSFYFWNKKNP